MFVLTCARLLLFPPYLTTWWTSKIRQRRQTILLKLRKLVVEKIRRDRINSSIELLGTLLHRGQMCGQQQQRLSKLEKADILELAVSFLQKETKAGVSPTYSQCLQGTLRHLSLHAPLQAAEQQDIKRFYVLQKTALSRSMSSEQHAQSADKRSTSRSSSRRFQGSLWRPWQ
ncbi:transcription factor HES-5-like isoform X1 [Oncorhynchus keta]|uniref:transcription factor HES-5-like isoform X1 n=1 Tax=Oncorhynchus keta TaxID=8018 RepID=UPI0015FCF83E|nr:transcription factor HES-5-like isoform X1 [Oncorhynchus keta]